jgi:hypothetical protein
MDETDLTPILAGIDDENLLHALWEKINDKSHRLQRPRNAAQRAFFFAWEATEVLNSDGFASLIELDFSLEQYAASFGIVGMAQVQPVFHRVIALIPPEMRNGEHRRDRLEFILGFSNELRTLLHDFLGATRDIIPVLSHYVREHESEFADVIRGRHYVESVGE